jgi:hypothetical protein
MDAHVDRKPRFLDAFVDWIVTTYQSIDTCAHPKFRQMIATALGTTQERMEDWFGPSAVITRIRQLVVWCEDKLPQASVCALRLSCLAFFFKILLIFSLQMFEGETVAVTTDSWTSADN